MWRSGVRTNAISPETIIDSPFQVGLSSVIQARGGVPVCRVRCSAVCDGETALTL